MTAGSGALFQRSGLLAKPSSATGHQIRSARYSGPGLRSSGHRLAEATSRKLFNFDRALNVRFIAGVDEAGRGSLAGPLVAAAVLFDYEKLSCVDVARLKRLNDSKAHTTEGREQLFPLVLAAATKVSVSSRSAAGIDRHGLHVSNLSALRECLESVVVEGSLCLVDGFDLPDIGHEMLAVVDGDARSAAIAAASVVAKVTRDRFMKRVEKLHPGWGFGANVGYSTPEHRAAIAAIGVSPLHRLSFRSIAYQQLQLDRDEAAA